MTINPAAMQNLGVRIAAAKRDTLATGLDVTGVIAFNERNVAVVQARAAGFVQRGYARAPGDVIAAGAPLAGVLVPEWGGAQREFLATWPGPAYCVESLDQAVDVVSAAIKATGAELTRLRRIETVAGEVIASGQARYTHLGDDEEYVGDLVPAAAMIALAEAVHGAKVVEGKPPAASDEYARRLEAALAEDAREATNGD